MDSIPMPMLFAIAILALVICGPVGFGPDHAHYGDGAASSTRRAAREVVSTGPFQKRVPHHARALDGSNDGELVTFYDDEKKSS